LFSAIRFNITLFFNCFTVPARKSQMYLL
jgi:hypothetical protein